MEVIELLEVIIEMDSGRVLSKKSIWPKNRDELKEYLSDRIQVNQWFKTYGHIFLNSDGTQIRHWALYDNGTVYLAFMQDKDEDDLVENTKLTTKTKMDLVQGRLPTYRVSGDLYIGGRKIK